MDKKEKVINIMTSCDDNLTKYVSIMLQSIADNLTDAKVQFFLMHSRISQTSIELLQKQCMVYENVFFHEIRVEKPEIYNQMAVGGGGWCGEAYYSLGAYELLPEDIDRILYLDAADTLIVGNIDEYYFGDFEGKSLIVTASQFNPQIDPMVLYESDDLMNATLLPRIVRGIFNSGSYVMNLAKMREEKICLETYLELSKVLRNITGKEEGAYWGDQGLLSAAFVGDMKAFRYPEVRNLWYMPYNFCIWYFDAMHEKPNYKPSVIHFAGCKFKPWQGKYPIFLEYFQGDGLRSLDELELGQAEYFYLWHEYALKTAEILNRIRTE